MRPGLRPEQAVLTCRPMMCSSSDQGSIAMQLLEGVEGAAISAATASLSAIAEYSERAGIQGPPGSWQAMAATIQAARRGQLPEAEIDGEGECVPADVPSVQPSVACGILYKTAGSWQI